MSPATMGAVAATCLPVVWHVILTCLAIWLAALGLRHLAQGIARRHRHRTRKRWQHGPATTPIPPASWRPQLSDLVVNAEFERIISDLHWESVRDVIDGPQDIHYDDRGQS